MSDYDDQRRENARLFHHGMAHQRGETPEKGWRHEREVWTPDGYRRMDSSRVVDKDDRRFTEYKSGQVSGKTSREQVDKDIYLVREEGWSGQWVTVAGERFDREIRDPLEKLAREFPERFQIIVVTKTERLKAIELGRQLEREAPQLELFDIAQLREQHKARQQAAREARDERIREQHAQEKEREQRERDKELARSVGPRELNEKREQLRKRMAEARKIAQPREKGRTLEIDKLRESHMRLTKDLADIREIERAKAREMVRNAGLGREHAQETERLIEQNHEDKRRDVTHELGNIGSTLAREDTERAEQEVVEKQREQVREVRERATREGIPREVIHVLEVGRIQPGEKPRTLEHERDHNEHRAREAAREREREAERERESRYRGG
ncbi:hypothetical protein [Nocardia sp. NPDC050412]|uniref:hypothetical protein n=1 Tax=unclassified Nocardia TaxID=2637762 RepID=UPI003793A727